MIGFTDLERGVFDAICEFNRAHYPDLRQILSEATITERKNTGHGFYTEFRAQPHPEYSWPSALPGPDVTMIDMGPGATMGFLLWCEPNGPTTLEGYQNGCDNGETVDFKFRDLYSLRYSYISPECR